MNTFVGRRCALCLLFFATGASIAQELTLATYSRDGKPFPLALEMQKNARSTLQQNLALLATAGGVDNVRAIRDRRAQAAFANAAVAYEASWGFGSFANSPVGVRTVATLYPHNLHIVVRADSTLQSVEDLRGRRVSSGAKGSGSEQIAFRLFDILRFDRALDLTISSLGLSDSIAALRDGKIDAFIFGSAAPVDAIAKLSQSLPIRFLSSSELVSEMNRRHGRLYATGEIAAETYAGQTRAIPTLDVWDLLVVDEKMSVDQAYRLAKTIDAQRTQLAMIQPSMNRVTPKEHAEISPIALHLGAQLFLAEKGIAPFNRLYRVGASQQAAAARPRVASAP
ncbi:MAG: TAXI family TRAP transporter solute-binding subunit [Casimicrobium sp.]